MGRRDSVICDAHHSTLQSPHKAVVNTGVKSTCVLLQEPLTPRHGLRKVSGEQQTPRQPPQQGPQLGPQQAPQQDPQQGPQHTPKQEKLEGTSFTARTTLTLDTALSLYNMTDSQSFWEIQQDTRCLIGWGSSTVVVAFRGTASMKNALADLQVPANLSADFG